MTTTDEILKRLRLDPEWAAQYADHLVATGRALPSCEQQDYRVPLALRATVLALPSDTGGDDYISWSSCPLPPNHRGPHYACLRHLGADQVAWINWLGPLSTVVVLTDCPHSPEPDDACPLFAGHHGPCPVVSPGPAGRPLPPW